MKFTNKHNLPSPLVQAVKNDPYKLEGDISVTGLLRPPQMAYLENEHKDEIEVDVSERIYALLGSAVHEVLERSEIVGVVQERRLSLEVEGWTVTGKADLYYQEGVLQDYKVTSVYSFLLGDKPDWEAQLNFYALMFRWHGLPVRKIEIVAILRDWMKSKSEYERNYPPAPALVAPVRLWTVLEAIDRMLERVRLHQKARAEGTFPDCTPEERWERPTKWAVVKPGNKKAYRVLSSQKDAAKWCTESEYPHSWIQKRPGKSVRCDGYCQAAPWCVQRKLELEQEERA